MNNATFYQRISFTFALAIFAVIHLGLELRDGGVVSHHLLARVDMPAISNWWGLLLLPALAWFLYPFMSGSHVSMTKHPAGRLGLSRAAQHRLAGTIVYVGMLGAAFEIGNEQIPAVLMRILFPLGIVIPLYRAELILGMVIGMAFTFGAVIPTIGTGVIALASYVTHSLALCIFLKMKTLRK